jgi:E3 ubiquitin-protein ligase SHPRH
MRPFAAVRTAARVDERTKRFFDVLEAIKKEKPAEERSWRVHLDLLNDLDELNMCKQAMRLSLEGEDLSELAEAELNAIVHPIDVASAYLDHGTKQAIALANLRRHSSTLRYLKNQNLECAERASIGACKSSLSSSNKESEEENCVLCLSLFKGGRAVLSCGHSFHYFPCLERLIGRSGNHHVISCPLQCTIRRKREEVMMATDEWRDDGSAMDRRVRGSWGTNVTRLVADVLDVSDRGEKSIVFSMWEDMLDVVEEALHVNKVSYVRATSLAKIMSSTKRFRSSDCTVLLLNDKNGAEGLTILEATHIFVVEPLLNCGLDIQGKLHLNAELYNFKLPLLLTGFLCS